MVSRKFHVLDDTGVKWFMPEYESTRALPFCVKHHMPLQDTPFLGRLKCDDCSEAKQLPRSVVEQSKYAANKIRVSQIAKVDVVNFDGELVPVSNTKVKNRDGEYSVTAQLMNTKHGKQVVIYAGKKGHKNAQIFVDTENHKLAFDHKDMKPTDVFAKIVATFKDGSEMTISSDQEKTESKD